jgi:hypothetical protein
MRGAVCFTSCRRVQTAAAHILAAPLGAHDDFEAWRKQHCDHDESASSTSDGRGHERRRRRRHSATSHDLDTSVLSAFARDGDDNVDSLDESVTTFLSHHSAAQLLPENTSATVANFVKGDAFGGTVRRLDGGAHSASISRDSSAPPSSRRESSSSSSWSDSSSFYSAEISGGAGGSSRSSGSALHTPRLPLQSAAAAAAMASTGHRLPRTHTPSHAAVRVEIGRLHQLADRADRERVQRREAEAAASQVPDQHSHKTI